MRMKKQTSKFGLNFIWNMIGTTSNALTSLIYMIIVTRMNGQDEAGFFTFAFSNACIVAIVGTYMGRTYQVSDGKHSETGYLNIRMITCLASLGIAIVINFWYGHTLYYTAIFLLWAVYKILDSYADVLYGVLQKNNRLDIVGISLTLKAVISVGIFTSLNWWLSNVPIASLGAVAGNLLVLVLYDIPHFRVYRKKDKATRKEMTFLLRDGFYIFGTTLLSTLLTNISRYIINAQGDNTLQANFGYLIMPATVMTLVGQYLLHPYLTRITLLFQKRNFRQLIMLVRKLCFMLTGIGLCSLILAWIAGIPLLELVYGVELSAYRIELIIVILGSICYGISQVFITVLTVMRRNKVQLFVYFITVCGSYLLAIKFIVASGVTGAVLTYLISMVLAALVFVIVMRVNLVREEKGESINYNSGI